MKDSLEGPGCRSPWTYTEAANVGRTPTSADLTAPSIRTWFGRLLLYCEGEGAREGENGVVDGAGAE